MSQIFISYSKQDQVYARRLADFLAKKGFEIWIDERIEYGEDWWARIVESIKNCAAFIVIMSPSSDNSRWVQREVTIADQLDKPTFPLLLSGKLLESKHWSMYVRTQYADVRDGSMPPDRFCNLLSQVTSCTINREVITPKPPHEDEGSRSYPEGLIDFILQKDPHNRLSNIELVTLVAYYLLHVSRDGPRLLSIRRDIIQEAIFEVCWIIGRLPPRDVMSVIRNAKRRGYFMSLAGEGPGTYVLTLAGQYFVENELPKES